MSLRQKAGYAGRQRVQRPWGSRVWGVHGDSVGGRAGQAIVCRTLSGILVSFVMKPFKLKTEGKFSLRVDFSQIYPHL